MSKLFFCTLLAFATPSIAIQLFTLQKGHEASNASFVRGTLNSVAGHTLAPTCKCMQCGGQEGTWQSGSCVAGNSPEGQDCKNNVGASGCYSSLDSNECMCPGTVGPAYEVTPEPTPAPTPPTPSPTDYRYPVDLCNAKLTTNNLGNQGPVPDALPIMRFANVTHTGVSDVDLMVSNVSAYNAWHANANDLEGSANCWGKINLKCGETVSLKFSFVSPEGVPASLEDFFFTVADIDAGTHGRCKESIEVSGFEDYRLSPTTNIDVTESLGAYTFVATTAGDKENNPASPVLTQDQQDNSIVFSFERIQTFTIIFHTDTDLPTDHSHDPSVIGYAGRNFLFAGGNLLA